MCLSKDGNHRLVGAFQKGKSTKRSLHPRAQYERYRYWIHTGTLINQLQVLEETGYNLAGQLDPENVVEMSINEQSISLFIVPGVPEDYAFKTKTRKEISVSVLCSMCSIYMIIDYFALRESNGSN